MQILDLPTAVPVGAMEDVMTMREEQIVKFGHTPEQDAMLPAHYLPKQARGYLEHAIDELTIGPEGWEARARKRLIRAAALILAAIDRLDADTNSTRTEGSDV
ncbi:MAG: hypothetical protein R3E21_08085 [Caenibius sp.]